MAAKKKNKPKSTAKSSKKVRGRATKAKISRKPAQKQATRTRASSKPKAKRGKKPASVNAENEIKREFQGRNPAGGSRASALQAEDYEGVSRAEQQTLKV